MRSLRNWTFKHLIQKSALRILDYISPAVCSAVVVFIDFSPLHLFHNGHACVRRYTEQSLPESRKQTHTMTYKPNPLSLHTKSGRIKQAYLCASYFKTTVHLYYSYVQDYCLFIAMSSAATLKAADTVCLFVYLLVHFPFACISFSYSWFSFLKLLPKNTHATPQFSCCNAYSIPAIFALPLKFILRPRQWPIAQELCYSHSLLRSHCEATDTTQMYHHWRPL